MFDGSFEKKLSDFVDAEIEKQRQGTHTTTMTQDEFRQHVIEALAAKQAELNAKR